MVAAFKPTIWAGKHHLWHGVSKSVCLRPPATQVRVLTTRTVTGFIPNVVPREAKTTGRGYNGRDPNEKMCDPAWPCPPHEFLTREVGNF